MENALTKVALAPDFYCIPAPDRARFPFSNSFLIDRKERVLIDAGIGGTALRELDKERAIDILIISHSHPDHILAAHLLKDRHLMLPAQSPESVHDLFELGKRFTGTDAGAAVWKKWMVERHGLKALPLPNSRYTHGDLLRFDGICLEAIHVPGHLMDHYAFLEKSSNTLLTTDIDFTGFGPWYGHGEADIIQFMDDVTSLAAIGAQCVCSSHKPPIRSGIKARFKAYYNGFLRQRDFVLSACSNPKSLGELVSESLFYNNRLPSLSLQRIYETNMIKKNLAFLVENNQIVLHKGRYFQHHGGYHEAF